jgi:hypothetical protein
MSKGTTTQQENGLPLAAAEEGEGKQTTNPNPKTESQAESEVNKPRKSRAKSVTSRLMTVDQYLKRSVKDQVVSNLIRSTHKHKIKSFADWEKETAALLNKNVW